MKEETETIISEEIKKIVKLEPLLMNILSVDVDQARIIALLILSPGGYVLRNTLYELLERDPLTISNKLQPLIKRKLIRENKEFKHEILTLSYDLYTDYLQTKLREKRIKQKEAVSWLERFQEKKQANVLRKIEKIHTPTNEEERKTIENAKKLRTGFKERVSLLIDEQPKISQLLGEILEILYIDQEDQLIFLSQLKARLFEKTGESLSEEYYERVMHSHSDIFHISKRMLVQPRLSLKRLAKSLGLQVQIQADEDELLLEDLSKEFLTFETLDRIPRYTCDLPRDVRRRVQSCLPNYNEISIIDNGIYTQRTAKKTEKQPIAKNNSVGILDLFAKSGKFDSQHKIRVLSNRSVKKIREIQLPDIIRRDQVDIRQLHHHHKNYDFMGRDYVLFTQPQEITYGCLIIPTKEYKRKPYYEVSPQYVKYVHDFFEEMWEK
ncbi:MAG: hypothetical protein ACFFBD_23345 [Candidatus Hodarchaeota archaeon]